MCVMFLHDISDEKIKIKLLHKSNIKFCLVKQRG